MSAEAEPAAAALWDLSPSLLTTLPQWVLTGLGLAAWLLLATHPFAGVWSRIHVLLNQPLVFWPVAGLLLAPTLWRTSAVASTSAWGTAQRLIHVHGWVAHHEASLEMYRIQDVDWDQRWWEGLLGIGTLTVMTSDAYHPRWRLIGVRHGKTIRDDLVQTAGRSRQQRGVREIAVGR